MKMTTKYPRVVYPLDGLDQLDESSVIVKYMDMYKFRDLLSRSSLYLRQIGAFVDSLEGRRPLAVWDIEHPEIKAWFDKCRDSLFVSCWNLDEDETPEMWRDYASNDGVRISSTVGSLTQELSHPSLPDGFDIFGDKPADAFTVGPVEYFDESLVDTYNSFAELSNLKPAFRKRHGFANEREYRAVLRAGSFSGEDARSANADHVYVPVRLHNLIHEVVFLSVRDADVAKEVQGYLADAGLSATCVESKCKPEVNVK